MPITYRIVETPVFLQVVDDVYVSSCLAYEEISRCWIHTHHIIHHLALHVPVCGPDSVYTSAIPHIFVDRLPVWSVLVNWEELVAVNSDCNLYLSCLYWTSLVVSFHFQLKSINCYYNLTLFAYV